MGLEDAANAGQTEQVRQAMIAKIGEKIELRIAELVALMKH